MQKTGGAREKKNQGCSPLPPPSLTRVKAVHFPKAYDAGSPYRLVITVDVSYYLRNVDIDRSVGSRGGSW